ncbi:MAG: YhgE/Pip family protein [Nakamurella sp.]
MIRTVQLGSYELRRFGSAMQRVAILFPVGIPLLYGALYLWSNWDRYGRLDQVPVAVVNLDQPVTVQGKTVDAGAQFVDQLRDERLFDWQFTDADDARSGLAEGRYYLTITVPKDFSPTWTPSVTA